MDDGERLARIRLVSRHYNELQGLRGALFGSAFTLTMGGYLFATGWRNHEFGAAVAMGAAFVFIIPGMLWLDRYYEATFGRVRPDAGGRRRQTFIIAAIIVAVVVLGKFQSMGIFLLLSGQSLWISIRDWPLRRHHLIQAAAAATAAAVQMTEAARQAPDSAMVAGFLVIGVAMMLTGFADHRLLTSSMAASCQLPATSCQLPEERRN